MQKLLQAIVHPIKSWTSKNQTVNNFLKAIKSGHSNTVLHVLAHNPKLLAHQAFLGDGDTVRVYTVALIHKTSQRLSACWFAHSVIDDRSLAVTGLAFTGRVWGRWDAADAD